MLFSSLPNTRSAYWPAHTRLSQRCVSIQLCCVSSYKTTDEVFQEQFFLWERGASVVDVAPCFLLSRSFICTRIYIQHRKRVKKRKRHDRSSLTVQP